ncbi:MAG: membrane protein insertase YidC [Flaviflexus sp.]|nr:membrane protein insertase YidC [Flaviflexus sp.]
MEAILFPFKWIEAWIMKIVHEGFTLLGMSDGPGAAWVLAIVGLTIIVRILIIPLFKRQIRAQRAQQLIQPELKKLQKKYKGKRDTYSQQRMQAEMQAIYKDAGTSPFASCMPLLVQMPIFFALFRLLQALAPIARNEVDGIGPIDQQLASDIEASTVFGAPLSASFREPLIGGGTESTVKIVAMVLVVLMCVSMFISQRMILTKNMPEEAKSSDNPMYRTQQMMIWIFPVIFLISGIAFPIGVLVYWVVSNLWATGQQLYMITVVPAPGSEAYEAKKKRDRERRIKKGLPPEEPKTTAVEDEEPRGQRQQPVGKNRAKRKGISKEEATKLPEPQAQTGDEAGQPKKKKSKKQRQKQAQQAQGNAKDPNARAKARAEERRRARQSKNKKNRGKN